MEKWDHKPHSPNLSLDHARRLAAMDAEDVPEHHEGNSEAEADRCRSRVLAAMRSPSGPRGVQRAEKALRDNGGGWAASTVRKLREVG